MSPSGKVTLVLCCLGLCAAAAWWHVASRQRTARLKPAELFDVVQQQFAACRSDDYPSAYRQASATIQQRFPLERFSDMIRNDNARLIKTGRVEFGAWQRRGNRAVVEALFIGRDGSVTPCLYSLVYEGDGWKIDGARWVRAWKPGQQMRGVRS